MLPALELLALLVAAGDACALLRLGGDEALVLELSQALATRGLRLAEPADPELGCQLRVDVTAREGRVLLRRDGEPEARELSDLAMAALLVETWTRVDLSAPLFAPRSAPAVEPPAPPPPAPSDAAAALTVPAGPDEPPLLAGRVGLVGGLSSEGATWLGGQLAVALLLGPVEPSVELRVLSGSHRALATQNLAGRLDTQLLAGVALPLVLGRLRLSPGLAAGVGFLRSARVLEERSPACDGVPAAEPCDPARAPVVRDGFSTTGIGARLEARVAAQLALGAALTLTGLVAAQAAPMARGESLVPAYATALSSGEAERLALAGEPPLSAFAALALGWEGP